MVIIDNPTKFSVREATQPRATYQVLASSKLLSGTTYTTAIDTTRWKESSIYTNISQISGTASGLTFNMYMEGSPYNDDNWFIMASTTQRNTVGKFYQKTPVLQTYIANWTRFGIKTLASNDGGIWAQVDIDFVR